MAEQAEPQTYGDLFVGGNECYSYEIEGKTFILVDRGNIQGGFADVYVIDVNERRYYTLHWYRSRNLEGAYEATCDCLVGIRYNRAMGTVEDACIHYQAWQKYFQDHIYEPAEL